MHSVSLPRPYPDELIGSVLCRAVIHTGHPPTRLVERICGRDRSNFSFFLPSMLARVGDLMRYDPQRLLWENTPFPFIVAYMSDEEMRRHEAKALSSTDAVGSLSALVQSVTTGLAAVKLCHQCAKDDVAEFGESYWHRAHSLPSAHVCLKHSQPLTLSSLTPRMSSRGLDIGVPQRLRGHPEVTGLDASLDRRLTELSVDLLKRAADYNTNWRSRHRGHALERGFATKTGEVAGTPLASQLRELFGKEYLAARSCFITDASRSWPALMVRERVTVPFSPVKHVLLQAFLERAQASGVDFGYTPPGKRPRDVAALDARLAKQVRRAGARANRGGVRVSTTQMLKGLNAWEAYRHRRADFPLTTLELLAFRKTEASERLTGGRDAHRRRLARRSAQDVAKER